MKQLAFVVLTSFSVPMSGAVEQIPVAPAPRPKVTKFVPARPTSYEGVVKAVDAKTITIFARSRDYSKKK